MMKNKLYETLPATYGQTNTHPNADGATAEQRILSATSTPSGSTPR